MNILAPLSITRKVTTIRNINTRCVGPISMKIYSHPPKLRLSMFADGRYYSKDVIWEGFYYESNV